MFRGMVNLASVNFGDHFQMPNITSDKIKVMNSAFVYCLDLKTFGGYSASRVTFQRPPVTP